MSLATFRRINMFISTVKLSNSARSMEGHDQPKEHSFIIVAQVRLATSTKRKGMVNGVYNVFFLQF